MFQIPTAAIRPSPERIICCELFLKRKKKTHALLLKDWTAYFSSRDECMPRRTVVDRVSTLQESSTAS